MDEPGGWLWAIIDIIGVVVLAAALIYGIVMWRHRRKDWAMRKAQNEVTRENYRRGG
jgi:type VI protein secretion system component VasK